MVLWYFIWTICPDWQNILQHSTFLSMALLHVETLQSLTSRQVVSSSCNVSQGFSEVLGFRTLAYRRGYYNGSFWIHHPQHIHPGYAAFISFMRPKMTHFVTLCQSFRRCQLNSRTLGYEILSLGQIKVSWNLQARWLTGWCARVEDQPQTETLHSWVFRVWVQRSTAFRPERPIFESTIYLWIL